MACASNLYNIEHQEALAEALADSAQMDSVFFCNSGAEANEAAIKLCRKFGFDNGLRINDCYHERKFPRAYHGDTERYG